MTKSCGNTEKYVLKNTTVIKLLKHYFFIKVLVTKEKKQNNVSSILTQQKVYQLMCKSATPTIWRLHTLVMSTLFAKNLSKFKITFFSFHNSHHRNKLFYNRYGHIFWPFDDIQNDRKIFVLVKEIFCSALQFATKQT